MKDSTYAETDVISRGGSPVRIHLGDIKDVLRRRSGWPPFHGVEKGGGKKRFERLFDA